jgi:hypothetical protein
MLWWVVFGCSWFVTVVDDVDEAPDTRVETREALEALGYLDFAEEPANPSKRGVHGDASRASPGINLYSFRRPCMAVATDLEGKTLARWAPKDCGRMIDVAPLPGGDVVLIATDYQRVRKGLAGADDADSATSYVARYDWSGLLQWRLNIPAHHDARVLSDGTIAVLTKYTRDVPKISKEHPIREERIALVSPQGVLLSETSLYDLMTSGPRAVDILMTRRKSAGAIDLLHTNTVERIEVDPAWGTHPLYEQGAFLVTSRRQDTVVALDLKGGTVWSWGRGELSGPHAATLLADGNLLLFDNGLKRKASRILELDPRTEEIVWSYDPVGEDVFFTKSRGLAQRLSNGNTLITSSDEGEAFEVTRAGERVWAIGADQQANDGKRSTFNQVWRIEGDWVPEELLSAP